MKFRGQARTLGMTVVAALFFASMASGGGTERPPSVALIRVPHGGIEPQVAVDRSGMLHMIYFKGDPAHGDIFYVTSRNWGQTFSSPMRVNSQPASAVALGTVRGAHLALGENGQVYVAWNGSEKASPRGPLNPKMPGNSPYNGLPMLFTRLNGSRTGFEPQRDLMKITFGLDGGGSVASDGAGMVYVAWEGKRRGDPPGEGGRAVWVARSRDCGRKFTPESSAWREPTGGCACCGISIFAGRNGTVYLLYRSATRTVRRDVYLLVSTDHGETFHGRLVDRWTIGACPMTSMAFAAGPEFVAAAWQTKAQVYYARIDPKTLTMFQPVAAPGQSRLRKYPALTINSRGDTLLVWTNASGWGQGGSLGWQIFDRNGEPITQEGRVAGVPPWSFGTAFEKPDGSFTVVY